MVRTILQKWLENAPKIAIICGFAEYLCICEQYYGLVAQSVEQRIENPCVGGSIPPQATKNKKRSLVERFLFLIA
jgi:hypothetical protein